MHGLLEAQEKATKAISDLKGDMLQLKVEIERLKAREEVLIARAEAAAATAAGAVAVRAMADTYLRLGTLEAQLSNGRRLPPPSA